MQPKLKNNIPKEYKFEYLRSFQRLLEIREQLKGFIPTNEIEEEIAKKLLTEYRKRFVRIGEINALVVKR
jgi:hypothetical protein